jgi:hypothetical protein
MDKRFRERAPHFERGPRGDPWVVEGLNSLPVGLFGPMVSEKATGGSTSADKNGVTKIRGQGLTILKPGWLISGSITSWLRSCIRDFA